MSERQVRVSLEGFGENALVANLTRREVEGKSFKEVVEIMVQKSLAIADPRTVAMIESQKKASGGYVIQAGLGTPNRFEPVRLDDKVEGYIQPPKGISNQETLRTTILGSHILGNYS